jgi:hypothetical protein
MCDLYSVTTGREAINALFRAVKSTGQQAGAEPVYFLITVADWRDQSDGRKIPPGLREYPAAVGPAAAASQGRQAEQPDEQATTYVS